VGQTYLAPVKFAFDECAGFSQPTDYMINLTAIRGPDYTLPGRFNFTSFEQKSRPRVRGIAFNSRINRWRRQNCRRLPPRYVFDISRGKTVP